MRRIVYRYPLCDEIKMPGGAKVLHVGKHNDSISLWAEVDLDNAEVSRKFLIVGTGQEFERSSKVYVGTVFDEHYVWHVWEDVSGHGGAECLS